eukprot:XP_001183520.2 PREDICTED: ankyrin repeat domain-containing protein 29-like [Strongylocentrotus purpuratus]
MAERAANELTGAYSALHLAAANGDVNEVQYLIGQGTHIDKYDEEVQCLVGNKAETDKLDGDGNTALYSASSQGHLHVVQYLVVQGAQVEKVDNKGSTSLIIASAKGHLDVVKYLISEGAKINKPDVDASKSIERSEIFFCWWFPDEGAQELISAELQRDEATVEA